MIDKPFHSLFFYIPRSALDGLTGQSRTARWPVNLALVAISSWVIRVVAPIGLTGVAVAVQAFGWGLLPALGLTSAPAAVIAFVALDLLIYLQHRVFHALPLFWRLHQVHHCDVDMDATTGVRFHPLEMLLSFGLKALAVARNLGGPKAARNFFAANLDFIQAYRSRLNVVARPTGGGKSRAYLLTGHHEIMVPLLVAMVLEELA